LEGQKYGILKFGLFWRIGVCIAGRIRVLFTVHTNVIVVTMIRISTGDLIAGARAATNSTQLNFIVAYLQLNS